MLSCRLGSMCICLLSACRTAIPRSPRLISRRYHSYLRSSRPRACYDDSHRVFDGVRSFRASSVKFENQRRSTRESYPRYENVRSQTSCSSFIKQFKDSASADLKKITDDVVLHGMYFHPLRLLISRFTQEECGRKELQEVGSFSSM